MKLPRLLRKSESKAKPWKPSKPLKNSAKILEIAAHPPEYKWTNTQCRNYLFAIYLTLGSTRTEAMEIAGLFEGDGIDLWLTRQSDWMKWRDMLVYTKGKHGAAWRGVEGTYRELAEGEEEMKILRWLERRFDV